MIHRNAQGLAEPDFHQGKWNGLGGKLELEESPAQAAQREFQEESGIELPLSAFCPVGVLQFPGFKIHKNEDWMVFVFVANLPSDQRFEPKLGLTSEGTLHWVPETEILSLNLWTGDRLFIPYVLDGKPFFGTIWYENALVVRHSIQSFHSLQPIHSFI